jgi:hypothetical protein
MSSVGGAAAGGARAPEKRKRGRPLGSGKKAREEVEVTLPVPRRHGCPPGSKNKKTLAVVAAAAAASSFVDVATVGSSAVVAAVAGPSAPALADALPAYTPVEWYRCFIVSVLPGAMGLLRLPSKFTEIMKGFDLSQAVLWEGSGGQPPYEVEVFYDGEGQSFSPSGWPQFCADYGV